MQPRPHLEVAVLDHAARHYQIDPALLSALMQVESGGHGFLPDGRVLIVFERHIFWRRLAARGLDPRPLARELPGLCGPGYDPRHARGGPECQYARLLFIDTWARRRAGSHHAAYMKAAWESCSYGLFQIMGFHYHAAGCADIGCFRHEAQQSEAAQLAMALRWLQHTGCLRLLRQRRFREFAALYNGGSSPGRYARRLWLAYQRVRVRRVFRQARAKLAGRRSLP